MNEDFRAGYSWKGLVFSQEWWGAGEGTGRQLLGRMRTEATGEIELGQ